MFTYSYGDKLEPLKCLGFLKGSNCPHYDGEADRRPVYQEMVASGILKPGIAADDSVAVHYVEQELHRIVGSRPNARAYRVYCDKGVREQELKTEYLGG